MHCVKIRVLIPEGSERVAGVESAKTTGRRGHEMSSSRRGDRDSVREMELRISGTPPGFITRGDC